MISSVVRTFTDPDDYGESIRATNAELTPTAAGPFKAKIIRINFPRLWIQRVHENLPRVAHSADVAARVGIAFRTHAGPSVRAGGSEMDAFSVFRRGSGKEVFSRTEGVTSIGSSSGPDEAGP